MKLAEALIIRKDLQKQLSKQIDDCSSRLRKLNMEIQGLNFLTELT